MADLIGQSFGRYHILEQLGEGGMATVYKAYDTRLETDVAVKVIRTDNILPSVVERALKRFEREAKALARLMHPNIVKVTDYGEHEGKPYLVMPYLPGGTLKQRLGKPVPWQQAIQLLRPIAEALDYAHSQNMIHRDVKPSNILLTERGQPMLTDFGIAKILDVEETMDLTGTSATVGTPEYMAPEQVTAKTIDHRADIYALGVVLYEMVTGRKPFIADTPMAVLFKHASEPLPRPTQLAPHLPHALEKILLKALAKSPDDRYQSMAELEAAFEKISSEEGKRSVEIKDVHLETSNAPAGLDSVKKSELERLERVTHNKPQTESDAVSSSHENKATRSRWLACGAIGTVIILLGICGFAATRFFPMLLSGIPTEAWATEEIPTQRPATRTPAAATLEPVIPSGTGCDDALGCVEVPPGEPIHLAYALTVSGPAESLGVDSRTGIEVAIALKGQVLGHDIQLTGEDDGCSSEGGQAVGERLAEDATIVAVIGPSCSSATRAAVPLLSERGIAVISPSNTLPDLTLPGDPNQHPGYFRTSYNDEVQGIAAAHFAFERLGVRRAATISNGSVYSDRLQAVFAETFQQLGGEITSQETIDEADTDLESILSTIAVGQPEFIYHPVFYNAGSLIINQAKQVPGLESVYLMGADGMFAPEIVDATGDAIEGTFVSNMDLTVHGEGYETVFLPKYREIAGTDPVDLYHAQAYDATNLLFAAIEQVAFQDASGALYIPRQALRDALYDMQNFKGLTGNLSCSPTGDCADPKVFVYEYHAGQYPPELIWP